MAVPGASLAAEQVLFGPKQYTRTSGPPNEFMETLALPPTVVAPFRLHMQNGNPDGTNRVSSATITLNGTPVAVPADFSQQVAALDRTVSLQANNTLQVRLTSLPGSFLVLTLYGTIPPPTLTKLEPPSLQLTEGATGTLTATISAVQSEATVITLQSSNTAVATVPATATVPAGTVTVAVPVAGVAPGTATITATLNGSSLQSTVTVSPSGPTITGLSPSTLQVTQGAAGMLTVTISAAQATDTAVALTTSDATIVGLAGDSVTVPAGRTSQAFAVFGNSPGAATITAALNGSTAQSQVTVVTPLPTVVSLLPPVLPLTEGSAGTLTVTLNASQPTDTDVFLSTSDPSIVGLPGDRVTVPANTLAAAFPVTGLARGTATVTASLNGSTATAAVEVQPPPPTVSALTCPATLTQGATGLCTVTLNATQLIETVVPLATSDPDLVTIPATVTVPANALSAQFSVTAGPSPGVASLTAGPLNGTSRSASVQVLPPPPTLVSLTPASATVFVGASVTLTVTLNAAQLSDTAVPLAVSPPGILNVPPSVTVPAGALTTTVTVTGLIPGTATVTAGPLNGTQAQSTITVNQLPPTLTLLTPTTLSLPKGKTATLTLTIAPTQSDPTVVPLTSSDPSVEVAGSVTVLAGASTAVFPVIARSEGNATITAGPLNGTSQSVTITVTPAELVTLSITPPAPTIAKGQTQQFTATGTYTDATTQDLTTTATWTSSDETVATITSGGLATAVAPGASTITATVGSVSATATLTVTPPILASLAVSPQNPTRNVNETLQFQATGTLTDGTTQDLTSVVTWSSSNAAVASISATGLATALAPGTTTITATHTDGFTASTTLTVTVPPPTLTSFTPASGKVGTLVTLTGTNLGTTIRVAFNGASASFSVLSATQVTATVPSGATSGPLTVTTPGGSFTTSGHFLVLPTQDFTLTVEPSTVTAIAGTSVSLKVSTVTTGGYTGLTQLSTGPLPVGVTGSFSPPYLGPNASGLLTLTTSSSTPSSSSIEVRGTATIEGTVTTRTATATLNVQAAGQTVLLGQVLDENITFG